MIGKTISHYKILQKIGSGGMGMVYQAEDTRLKRVVALKFLAPASTTDPEARQAFMLEAQAASALDHPNICTIHEIDETDEGQIFIAMAFYQGETLKEKIAQGPTSVREATFLTRQIAEGLAKAHEKDIVHRDIKPANIIVTEDGMVKILDFGVAEFQHQTAFATPGVICGTPAYMSPEQACGGTVDQRADIWSLGVILFELLTANPPFAAENQQALMQAIVNDPPLTLKQFLGQGAAEMQTIIDKTLAKDPAARYQSMRAFIDDLDLLERSAPSSADTQVHAAAQALLPSIAILPFSDFSAEKDQEYFCDGLAEEIIHDLSRLKGLRVASRNSAFQFKGQNLDIAQIGQGLKVDKVLEGSLRKAGNRIRIAVRLINVADGFLLWADEYQRELADIFEIQDDISRSVVTNLQIQLTGAGEQEPVKHYTDNVEAYSSYLRGRFYWNKRTTESVQTGIDYFKAAIEMDAGYALAYSGLADAHIVLGLYGRSAPSEVMPEAIRAAEQALRIDEKLPEAHISLACAKAIYEWNWAEAETHFKRGIELKPDYAEAWHWYAINFLIPLGRFEEAARAIDRALELDPASLVINATVGLVHYFSRRFDAATTHLRRALDKDPDFPVSNFFLGQALTQKGDFAGAMNSFQRALTFYGDSNNVLANHGYAAAKAGNPAKARKILRQLEDASSARYVSAYDRATILCGLGETEKALSWLEQAAQEHAFLLSYLNVDPLMDALRVQEKFQRLAKKITGEPRDAPL